MSHSQAGAVRVADAAPALAALSAALDVFEDTPVFDVDAALVAAIGVERAADELGDVALKLRARLLQADVAERKGKTKSVARTLWEVNAWARVNDCRPLLGRSHLLLAQAYNNLGDSAACLEHSVCAVEALDAASRANTRAFYLVKLADALGWTGSYDAARERYSQAEQIAVSIDDLELQRMALNNLAYSEYDAGEPERAWEAAQRMIAVAAADGRTPDTNELDTIARIHIALGRYAEAEHAAARAIDGYRDDAIEEADALAEYLLTLTVAQRHLGATERAQVSLDASRALCEERDLAEVLVRIQQEQAELYAASGRFELAFQTHKEFHEAAEELLAAQRDARARTRQAMFETAEARAEAERFREQARRDPLTGMRNRRYVDEQLPALISDAVTRGVPLSVAVVDLDHFKRINDTLSHEVGDQVLITAANLLEAELAAISEQGFVARMGGEEFLLVLPGCGLAEAARRLDTVRRAVRAYPWRPITAELPVTVSIGVVSTEATPNPTQADLLAGADRNLYTAKHCGRDWVATGPLNGGRRRFRA
jgi:diguanylate cyclase (GGDEF)-like protein